MSESDSYSSDYDSESSISSIEFYLNDVFAFSNDDPDLDISSDESTSFSHEQDSGLELFRKKTGRKSLAKAIYPRPYVRKELPEVVPVRQPAVSLIGWGVDVLGSVNAAPMVQKPELIGAGYNHSLCYTSKDGLLSFGNNDQGQLGSLSKYYGKTPQAAFFSVPLHLNDVVGGKDVGFAVSAHDLDALYEQIDQKQNALHALKLQRRHICLPKSHQFGLRECVGADAILNHLNESIKRLKSHAREVVIKLEKQKQIRGKVFAWGNPANGRLGIREAAFIPNDELLEREELPAPKKECSFIVPGKGSSMDHFEDWKIRQEEKKKNKKNNNNSNEDSNNSHDNSNGNGNGDSGNENNDSIDDNDDDDDDEYDEYDDETGDDEDDTEDSEDSLDSFERSLMLARQNSGDHSDNGLEEEEEEPLFPAPPHIEHADETKLEPCPRGCQTGFPNPVRGLWCFTVVQLACGGGHSLARTEEGFVFGWGRNNYGQLGLGDAMDRWAPCLMKNLVESGACPIVKDRNTFDYRGVAVNINDPAADFCQSPHPDKEKADNSVKGICTWIGCGDEHSLLIIDTGQDPDPFDEGFNEEEQHTSHRRGSLALAAISGSKSSTADHVLVSCGRASHGRLGQGPTKKIYDSYPRKVFFEREQSRQGKGLSFPMFGACGNSHNIFVVRKPTGVFIYTWGNGAQGQLGQKTVCDHSYPKPLALFSKSIPEVKKVVASAFASYILDVEGDVHGCGYSCFGSTDRRKKRVFLKPRRLFEGIFENQFDLDGNRRFAITDLTASCVGEHVLAVKQSLDDIDDYLPDIKCLRSSDEDCRAGHERWICHTCRISPICRTCVDRCHISHLIEHTASNQELYDLYGDEIDHLTCECGLNDHCQLLPMLKEDKIAEIRTFAEVHYDNIELQNIHEELEKMELEDDFDRFLATDKENENSDGECDADDEFVDE